MMGDPHRYLLSRLGLIVFLTLGLSAMAQSKPRFGIYREHDALVIRDIRNVPVPGDAGCEVIIYHVEPLTTRLTLWRGANNSPSQPVNDASEIRIADFFHREPLSSGAAVFVPRASVSDIVAATDRNDATLQDLLALFDGKRVYSFDMSRLRPPPSQAKVRNRWEGNDLVVEPVPATADAVIISFRRDDGGTAASGGTMQVLKTPAGEVILPAATAVRYMGVNTIGGETISIITTRAAADALRPVLMQGGKLPYAGLDVLLRSGTVSGADFARSTQSQAVPPPAVAHTAPPPPVAQAAAGGDLLTRLRTIRRQVPDPVKTAGGPDEVTTGVIASYDAFTAAIPQDILREPRVLEQVNQAFLDELAWDGFFKHVSFANSFGRLEYIRSQLDNHDPTKNIGEEFIFSYADRFLRRYPVERAQLGARVDIAERFFRMAPQVVAFRGAPLTVDKVIAEYYQLVGRFIASDAANAIEHWQNDPKLKLSDDQYVEYGKRLAAMEVYLPERAGFSKKFTGYVARGEWDKILQRATDEFFQKPGRARDLAAASYRIHNPRLAANKQLVFYDVSYTSNGQTKPMGHLVLVQPNARLRYGYTVKKGESGYTPNDLQQRFKGSHYYVITTGSYTESTGRTSGLSAENGVIKNFHVTHKMDGFVAFRHGAVDVLDLEGGCTLPGRSGIIKPIQSLRDFHTFITWLRTEGVSGFQTHLLVKNDKSAIDPDKTSSNRRERRLLLSMRDVKRQRVLALLDVPNGEAISFIEATAVVTRLMHDTYHYSVESAVNLDTGSYDILRVEAESGMIYKTAVDMDKATNLVVVYE